MSTSHGTLRQYWVALRVLLVATVVLGLAYPLAITLVARTMPAMADGSLLSVDGAIVGSSLIGQQFTGKDGTALPQWFQSRPSSAGDGYDGASSSGSNQGTESAALLKAIEQRRATIAALDGVEPSSVPADALTASASGLDSQISPDYARQQVARVAAARGLEESDVAALVDSMVRGRELGYLGEPTVNVLELNIAVAKLG
ncbi:MAG: Potassium transporter KtrA [Microbacteriaceae bacterium]|nr:Potassium transporter KtrA [Microbacteriaceae bacterium]